MDDNLSDLISRRSFLRRGACASLGMAGVASQMFTLRTVSAALANSSGLNGYKAAVCVFFFGGNDQGNTLLPYDNGPQNYDLYAAQRNELVIPQATLSNTIITPSNTGGRRFALHPQLHTIGNLFDAGNASLVANVGTLVEPMDKAKFFGGVGKLPSQLFAHNAQQEQWQISTADAIERIGWGGRVADALVASGTQGASQVAMNISLAGSNVLLSGRDVQPYILNPSGPASLNFPVDYFEGMTLRTAYADLMALQQNPSFAGRDAVRKAYAEISSKAQANAALVGDVLDAAEVVPPAPPFNLARQLEGIAKMIEGAQTLGHSRQIFFCAIGGFDNHDGLIGTNALDGAHAARLQEVNESLAYFWNALGALGMRDAVTTFTASDFGRTYVSNGDGSDHGWGADHIIMGGNQLNGGQLFGTYPDITINGPDDTGQGRYIPTTSVDAYSFEIARWLDVPISEMQLIFPNLFRFLDVNNPATHLGILA
ncbi:MAG: DUF1501 domain-containing protein [Planctomycetota bacterium]